LGNLLEGEGFDLGKFLVDGGVKVLFGYGGVEGGELTTGGVGGWGGCEGYLACGGVDSLVLRGGK